MTRFAALMALFVAWTVQAAPNKSTFNCLTLLTADPCKVTVTGTKATVRLQRASPGRHGGQIWIAERTGRAWGSRHTTVHYDVQGDPRWFIDAIGCRAAGFFGFEVLSESLITVPDRLEFAGAVAKLNRRLQELGFEAVSVSFYEAPLKFSSRLYLERFVQNLALPIAPAGNHFIHDISFHTGAIFFSERMLRAGAELIQQQMPLAENSKSMRMELVELVDVATSVPNLRLIVSPKETDALTVMRETLARFDEGSSDSDAEMFRRLAEIRAAVRSLEP